MRIGGAFLLIILLAAAIVIYLQSRSAHEDVRAVRTIATDLRESGVEAAPLDRGAAAAAIRELRAMVDGPETIADSRARLREIAAAAAAWAQAASGSDLDAAVAIRSAADELWSYALYGGGVRLATARRQLEAARRALGGEPRSETATGAVRDRLENLQRSQEESLHQLDEALQQ